MLEIESEESCETSGEMLSHILEGKLEKEISRALKILKIKEKKIPEEGKKAFLPFSEYGGI